jgi:hypothetical protein
MRSQDPKGVEKVQPLQNASEVYTLHAGRWRGATWHDLDNNTVWLLAGRLHRSGAPDDASPNFKDLIGRKPSITREPGLLGID